MLKQLIPMTHCSFGCTKCIISTEFYVFECGFNSFDTYFSKTNNTYYRIDSLKISNYNEIIDKLALIKIPDELTCKFCKTKYEKTTNIQIIEETYKECFILD